MNMPRMVVSPGCLSMLNSILELDHRRILIVTDQNVAKYHLPALRQLVPQAATVVLKPGEAQKSLSTLEKLYQACSQASIGRTDAIIAFGGGVIGDLAGLCAATWKRGCSLIQIPTTLMAMADAAIGSKTAIDFEGQKNVIGCFYDPEAIIVDTEMLSTLSLRELRNGLVEVIKIAALFDRPLLDALQRLPFDIASDLEQLTPLIKRAIDLKLSVVQQDPYDQQGHRALLNYGHTLGHAIEAWGLKNLERPLLHGEAVGLGMTLIDGDPMHLLEQFELPIDLPPTLTPNDLIESILVDKKRDQSAIWYVSLDQICMPTLCRVEVADLPKWLNQLFIQHQARRAGERADSVDLSSTVELL